MTQKPKSAEPKRGRGKPPHKPDDATRTLVQAMRANGVPVEVIARRLEIDVKTLRRHYDTELASAKEDGIAVCGGVVLQAAFAGDWRAALEWLARWGGPEWQKPERRLISGDPLGASIRHQVDVSQMTAEEIAAEIAELDRKIALAENPPAKTNGAGSAH